MVPDERAADWFIGIVREHESLWNSIDLRVIAVKRGDSWYNVLTRGYLDHRDAEEITRFSSLPRGPHFVALQAALPIDSLGHFLGEVREGVMNVEGTEVRLEVPSEGPGENRRYSVRGGLVSRQARFQPSYPHWPAYEFSASGEGIDRLLRGGQTDRDEIDNWLRTREHPYDGVSGLAMYFLGMPSAIDYSRNASVEVFAPIEVQFLEQESRLAGGELQAMVRAGSRAAAESFSIGLFALDGSPLPVSRTLAREEATAPLDGRGHQTELRYRDTIPGGRTATLFLRVGDACVDRLDLFDAAIASQPRIHAYASVDAGWDVLTSWLAGEGKAPGRDFERAVARVFHLAGFAADLLASEGALSDAVDVLAFDRGERLVFAIECTTGALDTGGKLGRLNLRAAALRKAVGDHTVVPVIASAALRDHLAAGDLSAARENRMSVLAREDLHTLLELAKSGTPTLGVSAWIRERVPSTGGPPLWSLV